jgi:EmrB/QacA subfamily drug resistance transporter
VTEDLPRRVIALSMTGIVITMFMAALDATIVATAMPRIVAELNGFELYAAVTTVYLLATTVVVPIVGKLSDIYGRKAFLLAGVTTFVAASMLCGAAQSMPELVFFRAIQGIGGGFSQAMAFTTIADLFPPSRRGRVSGMLGAVFGLASVTGPAVGGFLTDGPGWRWCFYVNAPIGALAFAILLVGFPARVTRRRAHQIDWLGAALLILSMVPLLLALEWGGREYAWQSPQIATLAAFGLVMFGAFLVVETRAPEAIMPPSLFRNRVVGNSALAAMALAVAMFGATLFIPLFIQSVIGASATRSGAVLTPMMTTMVLASGYSGFAVTRRGKYKALAVFGAVAATVGLFLLSRLGTSASYAIAEVSMIVLGIGLGVTLPIFPLAVQNAVDVSQTGMATAVIQFVRSLGGSLGAAIFGAVLANAYDPAFRRALSPEVVSRTPAAVLNQLRNPQMLLNPNVSDQLSRSDPDALRRLGPVAGAVKSALAVSLHDVFLCATVLVGLSVIFTLLLVDIPLRTTNRTT